MCESLDNFSHSLSWEKVVLLEGDPNGGLEFWGKKPACAAMTCADSGFGKPNGIPTDCKALHGSADHVVGWVRFEDQTIEDGEVHKEQRIPQAGTLRELWQESMDHSGKVSSAIA